MTSNRLDQNVQAARSPSPPSIIMPKAGKSSASSGTRKKHAKKSGKGEEDAAAPQQPAQRGQKKLSKAQKKAQPKVKQYIPPPKPPAPPIPDPLDGQGLARSLPADLVVILRRLGKKDEVTRRKGLEELREWVSKDGDEVEKELQETALFSAVPVWVSDIMSNSDSSCTTSQASSNPPSTARSPCSCNRTSSLSPPFGRLSSTRYRLASSQALRTAMFSARGLLLLSKMGVEPELLLAGRAAPAGRKRTVGSISQSTWAL